MLEYRRFMAPEGQAPASPAGHPTPPDPKKAADPLAAAAETLRNVNFDDIDGKAAAEIQKKAEEEARRLKLRDDPSAQQEADRLLEDWRKSEARRNAIDSRSKALTPAAKKALQRVQKPAVPGTPAPAAAAVPGAVSAAKPGTPAQTPAAEPVYAEVKFQAQTYPRVPKDYDPSQMQFRPLDAAWFREKGLDPKHLPVEIAESFSAVVRDYNNMLVSYRHVLTAMQAMNKEKDNRRVADFGKELQAEFGKKGVEVTEVFPEFVSKIYSESVVNGKLKLMPDVARLVAERYPSLLKEKKKADPQPPEGTTTARDGVPPPSGEQKPKPKTLAEAAEGAVAAAKKMWPGK